MSYTYLVLASVQYVYVFYSVTCFLRSLALSLDGR